MTSINTKKTHSKWYIITFFILVLIYIVLIRSVVSGWIRNNREHMMKDSLEIATSYALNLEKSIAAREALLEMIDRRLLVANTFLSNYQGELNESLVNNFAKDLEIDVIYAYNKDGVIEYTNDPDYIGWKVVDGHPVKKFMDSQKTTQIDELRRNVETNQFFKYGYTKLDNGRFFQIGIADESTEGFLEDFTVNDLLQKMEQKYGVVYAHFVEEDYLIVESTDKENIGKSIKSIEAQEAIDSGKPYHHVNGEKDKQNIEIYVPVYENQGKTGTLVLGKRNEFFLEETEKVVKYGFLSVSLFTVMLMAFVLLM